MNIPRRGIFCFREGCSMKQNICQGNPVAIKDTCCGKKTVRETELKENLTKRLNRIEGQVRGIKGMIDKDAYCNDVLIQISAVQSALDSVGKLVLERHIRGCLVDGIREGDEHIIDELLVTIGKMR